ncbi:MAG: class I SAM-dependent methyltransferase [Bacteroidota bacterium]|nr:class I SAM-dependent methyltransferase [Bacteroidota bacterium]
MKTRNESILEIIKCPITNEPLFEFSEDKLSEINSQIIAGEITFLNGKSINNPIDGAYYSKRMGIIYPVIDDIIFLLPKYALVDTTLQDEWSTLDGFAFENQELENFYEEFGWKKNKNNVFEDAAKFEDLRGVSRQYIHDCHMRVKKMLPKSGRFLLDAASGPIQFDEYLEYSKDFDYRVCLDISSRALQQARAKLGDKGIYIIGDIANIPLKSNVIDAVVSLNTIYHIPKDQQLTAFQELHRVLSEGAPALVVYEWGRHSHLMNVFVFPYKIYQHAVKRLKKYTPSISTHPNIYFHAFNRSYFNRNNLGFEIKTYVWRSVSVPFMKIYVHAGLFGKLILRLIFKIEEKFPAQAGAYGEYPMFYFSKESLKAA